MRRTLSVALLAVVAVAAIAAAQGDSRPGVAIMPFANGGSFGQDEESFDALQVGLAQMLITEISLNQGARVVERHEINRILQEQDLGASGRVDVNTAARIGRMVGAKYMILGTFMDVYGDFRIDARIVDVETTEIIKTERVQDKRENLYHMMTEMANKIMEDASLPAIPASIQEQRESRDVPQEAVDLYSRGLLAADRGDSEKAVELFNRALSVFPEYTEAEQELALVQQ